MENSRSISGTVTNASMRRRAPKWAMARSGAKPQRNSYYLRSIGRALDVLDCFDAQTPLSLKEICARVRIPESSLFRVLRTLEEDEYLLQFRDGTYQLAPRLIFGWPVRAADHLRRIARPALERLVYTFDEAAGLAYLCDDRIHLVDYIESFHDIRMTNKIGSTLPPHCSAPGKAITAFQTRELADRLLEIYGLTLRTKQTITDRQELLAEFEHVRQSGIACDREESTYGRICFAAAIRPKEKPVVSAISLSMPASRVDGRRELQVREALSGAAELIASSL